MSIAETAPALAATAAGYYARLLPFVPTDWCPRPGQATLFQRRDWLAPFLLTTEDDAGTLTIHSKGFRVDWLDPRFANMDARVRGVHYCHLIAPGYLRDLLSGGAAAGLEIGGVYTPPAAPRQ